MSDGDDDPIKVGEEEEARAWVPFREVGTAGVVTNTPGAYHLWMKPIASSLVYLTPGCSFVLLSRRSR